MAGAPAGDGPTAGNPTHTGPLLLWLDRSRPAEEDPARELDRVLGVHPAAAPAARVAWLVGLAEAALQFSRSFKPGAVGGRIDTERHVGVLRHFGWDLWLVGLAPRAAPGAADRLEPLADHACDLLALVSEGRALRQEPRQAGGVDRAARAVLDLALEHLARGLAARAPPPSRFTPLRPTGRAGVLGLRRALNGLAAEVPAVAGCVVLHGPGLLWSDLGRDETAAVCRLLAAQVVAKRRAAKGGEKGGKGLFGRAWRAPSPEKGPGAAAGPAERLLRRGAVEVAADGLNHLGEAVDGPEAALPPLVRLDVLGGRGHDVHVFSRQQTTLAAFAPAGATLGGAARERLAACAAALQALDLGPGPGDRAPAALRDREVTYWSRDRATRSASRAEGEAVRGLPGPARALLGQIERDLDADGGGGDQREICIRPTHSSWVAGARAGQRELYVHIPHADSLVEASGLVAQALAQEGLAAASI